jgi:hypothetical protein
MATFGFVLSYPSALTEMWGLEPKLPVTRLERSRWRGGRFACYAPHVMLQGSAFNFDFRFSLILLSHAKSIGCKRKRIQFP